MAQALFCVVCNQPWPEGEYHHSEEQKRRESAAFNAHFGLEKAEATAMEQPD